MSYSGVEIARRELLDFQSLDSVFIDLDDTIVDYRNCSIYGLGQVKRMVPELGSVDLGTMEQRFRELLGNHLPDLFDGKLSVDGELELRMEKLLKSCGIEAEGKLIEKCQQAFSDGFWLTRSLIDGASELLELWRDMGLPVVVITNGNPEMQDRTLKMLGVREYVHTLLTPYNSGELKPNPGLFNRALDITGASRERTVMIGDTWKHDIVGAINAGIRPVWINRRMFPKPEPVDVLEIRTLRELF